MCWRNKLSAFRVIAVIFHYNRQMWWEDKALKLESNKEARRILLRLIHAVRFFSDCDCDSSYRNKWVAQDSVEVFTLCDCNHITNSYIAHYEQKQIAVANRQCERALIDTQQGGDYNYGTPLTVAIAKMLNRFCTQR